MPSLEEKYPDLLAVIKVHRIMEILRIKTTIRHIAFSLLGEYMVCVGEWSNISFTRGRRRALGRGQGGVGMGWI
jgi:hypothetical protein